MLKLGSVIAMALLTATANASIADGGAKLYVAKNGNDAWSGLLAAPNKTNTDGPLATLRGARDAVRILKSSGEPVSSITVYIREGTYFLDEPLVLTSADSGTRECPITYEAYRTAKGVERVVISGGRTISGFSPIKVNGHDMIAGPVGAGETADDARNVYIEEVEFSVADYLNGGSGLTLRKTVRNE